MCFSKLPALRRYFSLVCLTALNTFPAFGQAPASSPKDELIFTNGERLIGELQRSTGDSVVFKSDMAGQVTVTWSSIRELHTRNNFAVLQKGVKLRKLESADRIPQGAISAGDGHLEVLPKAGPPVSLPLSQTADVIDEDTFRRVFLHRPNLLQNWRGTATVGLGLVAATQKSQSYTSAASFIRDVPGESWMDPETRTSASFNSSYGQITQPNTPTVKTSIFHAVGERDRYFSPRLFSFVNLQYDHDFSQGLDLQQIYSAGIGFSVIKSKNEQLDFRAALGYEKQQFTDETRNQNLLGSIFSESYNHAFPKATLHQDLSITPSWSNLNAYSATSDLTLTIPVILRFSFTTGLSDTFLNNPSPGFKKNSFQFSSGITYTVK